MVYLCCYLRIVSASLKYKIIIICRVSSSWDLWDRVFFSWEVLKKQENEGVISDFCSVFGLMRNYEFSKNCEKRKKKYVAIKEI